MAGNLLKIVGEIRTSLFSKTFKQKEREVTAPMAIPFSISLPAAKVGQLTTRTNDTVGILTMAASHGIATADVIDIYWILAGVYGRRLGVVVGTVATNSVPFSLGEGDNLPDNLTNVTVMEPHTEALAVTGNEVQGIVADSSSGPATVRIMDDQGTPATALAIELDLADDAYIWDVNNTIENPLADLVTTQIRLSHGDSTKAATIRGAVYYG